MSEVRVPEGWSFFHTGDLLIAVPAAYESLLDRFRDHVMRRDEEPVLEQIVQRLDDLDTLHRFARRLVTGAAP